MKNLFIFFIALFSCINSHAQFGPQQVITTDAQLVRSVFAADIDGDGDMDVLSASAGDDKIAWYENTNGLGNFGPQNTIAFLDQTDWVRAADLDGDNDIDVLALTGSLDLLVWYENLDGLGSFSAQKIINTNVDLPQTIIAADINGDGDMDVISASRDDNKIAWYENTDGQGNFGAQQIISNSTLSARSIYAADIDDDGDIDVMATSAGSKRLYLYENTDGQGNFGSGQIIVETPDFNGFVSIFAIDLDGDDDMDVLSAEFGGNRLAWYENTDGQGSFGPQKNIDTVMNLPIMVFAADLDNDNDNDVLSVSAFDQRVVWYENLDGLGNFGPQQIISTEVPGVFDAYAADIDNDTDIDVLSASQIDDKIAWYENLTILGIKEYSESSLLIYPNPSSSRIFIKSQKEPITKIELCNLLGEKIQTFVNIVENINIANLQAGIYLLKIHVENRTITKKIIKM